MTYIIGIGGPSRSGKSSLAQKIKSRLSDKRVLLLAMDDFVFPVEDIPKIRDRTDWERPESVNFEEIISTIKGVKSKQNLLIIEGILAYVNIELRSFYDFTIQTELSKETFIKRRKLETRWGDEPDWFLEHVWNSYLKYGQYPKADLVLSGEEELEAPAINNIIKRIAL